MNSIKLIEGFHITSTERKALITMLRNGWVRCSNKPRTKTYEILQGTPIGTKYRYKIRIGSFFTATIGANPQWNYCVHLIEADITKNKPQLSINF